MVTPVTEIRKAVTHAREDDGFFLLGSYEALLLTIVEVLSPDPQLVDG